MDVESYDANDLLFYNMIEICLVSIEKQLIDMFDVIHVDIDFEKLMCSRKNMFQSLINIMDNYFVMTLGLMNTIDYPSPCKVVLYEMHSQIKLYLRSLKNKREDSTIKIEPVQHFLESFRKLMHDINTGVNISGEYDLETQKKALDLFDLLFTTEYYITIFSMFDHLQSKQLIDPSELSNVWLNCLQISEISTLLYSDFMCMRCSDYLSSCMNHFMENGFIYEKNDLSLEKITAMVFLYTLCIFNKKSNDPHFIGEVRKNTAKLKLKYDVMFETSNFKTHLNDHVYENCKQVNKESVLFDRFKNMDSLEDVQSMYTDTLNYEDESRHSNPNKHKKRNKILYALKCICKHKNKHSEKSKYVQEDLIILKSIEHLVNLKKDSNNLCKNVSQLLGVLDQNFVHTFSEDLLNYMGHMHFTSMIKSSSNNNQNAHYNQDQSKMIMGIPLIEDHTNKIFICQTILDSQNIKLADIMNLMLEKFDTLQYNPYHFSKILEFISLQSGSLNEHQRETLLHTLVYTYVTIMAQNSNKYHCGLHEKIVSDEPNKSIPKTKFQYNIDAKKNLKLIPSFLFSRSYDNKYYDKDFPVDVFPNKQNHEYTQSSFNHIMDKGMKFSVFGKHDNEYNSLYETIMDYLSTASTIVDDQSKYKKKFNSIFMDKKLQNKHKKHPVYFLNMQYANIVDYIMCFDLFVSCIKVLCKNSKSNLDYHLRYTILAMREKVDILNQEENKLRDGCPPSKTIQTMDKLIEKVLKNNELWFLDNH